MNNIGTGYPGFRASIDVIADCLGGEHTRAAIAHEFVEWLYRAVAKRSSERFPTYHGAIWTTATEDDFDWATAEGVRQFSVRHTQPIKAQADWPKGGTFVLRGDSMYLEAREHQMYCGSIIPSTSWDYRTQGDLTSYRAVIQDPALRLLNGKDSTSVYGITSLSTVTKTSATARSPAAGEKSLIRLFEGFFKVKFETVKEVA